LICIPFSNLSHGYFGNPFSKILNAFLLPHIVAFQISPFFFFLGGVSICNKFRQMAGQSMTNELERNLKQVFVASSRYQLDICLERLKKTRKILSQDNQCPGWYLKRISSKFVQV
jgi:hypothetical protein